MIRLGKLIKRLLTGLGALMLLVTVAPPRWYASMLAGNWAESRGPVLIVLGADLLDGKLIGEGSYWRTIYAILVWRQGGVRNIVLSGEMQITGPMRDYLISQGIPAEAIVVEGRSRNTRENALYTAELLKTIPGPYVLLTSDYHMYRASRAFAKAGVAVGPHPFPDALKQFGNWTARWGVLLELVQESGKIVYYRARGWI